MKTFGVLLSGACIAVSVTAVAQDRAGLATSAQLASTAVGAAEAALIYSISGLQTYETLKQQQEEHISNLILERGTYGYGIDEAHANLGRLHFDNGEYARAAQQYKQAWHLSRVNTGLYSEQQLKHIADLIAAQKKLKNWEQVDDLHGLSFQIASRVYSPGDERYLAAVETYTGWQSEAIRNRRNMRNFDEAFARAQELSALYTEVIDRVEHADSQQVEGLVNLLVSKVRTDISIGRALWNSRLSGSVLGPGSFITETECFAASNVASNGLRQCRQVYLSSFNQENGSLMSVNFALGRYLKQVDDSIKRLEKICESGSDLDIVEKRWMEQLVLSLKAESDVVFQPVRRT